MECRVRYPRFPPVESLIFLLVSVPLCVALPNASAWADSPPPRTSDGPTRQPRVGLDSPIPGALSDLPTLEWTRASSLVAAWNEARKFKNLRTQLRHVDRTGLLHRAATDLMPLSRIGKSFFATYQRRDHYRDRLHASPEMTALLRRAAELLTERLPEAIVTIGDVSQAGGGQIAHGVRLRILKDTALRTPVMDLARHATPRFGSLVYREVVDPETSFPLEAERFTELASPLLVEETLTSARTDRGFVTARVETRRYWLEDPEATVDARSWWRDLRRELPRWTRITQRREPGDDGALWQTRYLRKHRLLEIISRKKPGRRLALQDVVEVRRATLNAKKPGVRMNEVLLQPVAVPNDPPELLRWKLLYEASHISHDGGLDVDMSYLLLDPSHHFSRRVHLIQRTKTRLWLRTLADAAEDVGVTIERILVDRRVKRHLLKGASAEERRASYWDLLGIAKGHDSHLHLRLAPGFSARIARCTDPPCAAATTPLN